MDTADSRWTNERPEAEGYYEIWDPRRRLNQIVHVVPAPAGPLAVRNFGDGGHVYLLDMWSLPDFFGTHWCGPLLIPGAVSAGGEACSLTRSEPSGLGGAAG